MYFMLSSGVGQLDWLPAGSYLSLAGDVYGAAGSPFKVWICLRT